MPRSKVPIVFVPGLGANGAAYQPFLRQLAGYDIRSADHSLDLPDPITWEFWCRTIDQAAGDAKRFTLIGQSLGGAIALYYAAHHPQRVAKVIAVAPVLWPFHRQPRSLRIKVRNFLAALRAGNIGHFLTSLRTIRERRGMGRSARLHDWAGTIDLTKELGQPGRLTIFWHQHEEVIPWAHYRRLLRQYPAIDVRLVPGYHLDLAIAPGHLTPLIRKELDE